MSVLTGSVAVALIAPQGEGGGIVPMLLMWGAIIAIFYFLLIRPQRKAQKEHQEMVARLTTGDRVMTEGGILGEVIHLTDEEVTIKTGQDTRLVIARAKIARVFSAMKAAES